MCSPQWSRAFSGAFEQDLHILILSLFIHWSLNAVDILQLCGNAVPYTVSHDLEMKLEANPRIACIWKWNPIGEQREVQSDSSSRDLRSELPWMSSRRQTIAATYQVLCFHHRGDGILIYSGYARVMESTDIYKTVNVHLSCCRTCLQSKKATTTSTGNSYIATITHILK